MSEEKTRREIEEDMFCEEIATALLLGAGVDVRSREYLLPELQFRKKNGRNPSP